MSEPGIPTDGPETVLGQVARRLRLRYSRTFVARSVARHPQPSSLLALVETAKGLGMKVTAGQTEASVLAGLDSPTIVHFTGAEGGGFGVLEGVTAEGFKVWDNTRGLHLIERDAFLRHWSGVVALVEPGESEGTREEGYFRNRLTEIVFSGFDPPAVVGHKTAPLLRAGLGGLMAILLTLSVAVHPTDGRAAALAFVLLSIAGLAVTVLTGVSIAAQDGVLSDKICARGKLVDCHSVLGSRYSRIFGISLSDIGIALYGSLLLLLATGSAGSTDTTTWVIVGFVYLASAPFSLALVGAQVSMKQLCTLCLAVHSVNLAGATVAWLWLRSQDWSWGDTAAPLLLVALFFCMILFLVIPYFKKQQGLRILGTMHRRISESPFASLAEIMTEAPTGLDARSHGVALGGRNAGHELAVFVHPSCGKCDSVLGQVRALVDAGLVDAYVGLAPKDPEESDRRACSAVVAAGVGLGPERFVEAYAVAKKNLRALMTEDPVRVLTTELAGSDNRVDGAFEEAQRVVDRAERFVDAHAEGTPAVFFDSRLYRGPLAHLGFLLKRHPDLLEEIRLTDRPEPKEAFSS